MLFNSTIFLFDFPPVTLLLFFVLGRFSIWAARLWLAAASLFFYAWWNSPYLILLGISIAFNHGAGHLLQYRDRIAARLPPAKFILRLRLAYNLGFPGYFKYSAFFVENFDALTGADLVLPISRRRLRSPFSSSRRSPAIMRICSALCSTLE